MNVMESEMLVVATIYTFSGSQLPIWFRLSELLVIDVLACT